MTEERNAGEAGETADPRIEAEVRTTASPAEVWRAWTRSEGLAAWFVDRATGGAEPGDVQAWHWDRFGFEARQVVREARPGERLVLEAETERGARLTEITIRRDAGATVIRVVDSGFHGSADETAGVASGWRMALAVLRHALEVHPGEARGQVLSLRPLPPGVRAPHGLYAAEPGLGEWLGRRKRRLPSAEAEAFLEMPGAGAFTGRRLLDTGRECLWHWAEVPALVEMKAFRTGPQWTVGLAVSAWGTAASLLGGMEPALGAAVGRLLETASGRKAHAG